MILQAVKEVTKTERLLNGDFVDGSNWTLAGGDSSISGGQFLINGHTGSGTQVVPSMVAGKKYTIIIDVASISGAMAIWIGSEPASYNPPQAIVSTSGISVYQVTAGDYSQDFIMYSDIENGTSIAVNSVSLEEDTPFYQPIDVFDDFEIKYNHLYDDASSLSGNKLPYTNKFKLPLNQHNRNLLGIDFDLTFPKEVEIDGVVTDEHGGIILNVIYQVQSQVINVLEPYINISMIDDLSYAIRELAKGNLSEMLENDDTKFSLRDGWIYNDQYNLSHPDTAPFVLPFYNWNNKDETFAYDPKRDLSQLQPTFILKYFVKQIFNYVGVDIQSKFLFEDDQLSAGIKAEDLGLMIPTRFFSTDTANFTIASKFKAVDGLSIGRENYVTRQKDIPSPIASMPRIIVDDFNDTVLPSDGIKMNWIQYLDYGEGIGGLTFTSEFVSMVDGKLSVTTNPRAGITKPAYIIGAVSTGLDDINNPEYTSIYQINSGTPANLDVKLVATARYKKYTQDGSFFDSLEYSYNTQYDIGSAMVVGEAVYKGLSVYDTSPDRYGMEYEINLFDNIVSEFDVDANQEFNLSLVVTNKENTGWSYQVGFENVTGFGTANYTISINDGFISYRWDNGFEDIYPYIDSRTVLLTDKFMDIEFSFLEPTEYPPLTLSERDKGFDAPEADIDLSVSYKEASDEFKLLDIIKIIMERYNLTMFTRSDGSVHIDSRENRSIGTFRADPLINEEIEVVYTYSEKGLLTMTDSNPQFYEEDYNQLLNYEVNPDKKDVETVSFRSCIVNKDMFIDEYDDLAFDLLSVVNSTSWWGMCDRKQVEVKDIKATFVLLKSKSNPVRYPTNTSTNNYIYDSSSWNYNKNPLGDSDIGFINIFEEQQNAQPKTLSCEAVTLSQGFDLLSFEDNLIRPETTLFNTRWENRVKALMDNNVTTIALSIYVSQADFIKLIAFPEIDYYGSKWNMIGLTDFPVSNQDGGIATLELVQIDEVPPPPPVLLTPFPLVKFTSGFDQTAACADAQTGTTHYHNGINTYPEVDDYVYVDIDGVIPYNGAGGYTKAYGSGEIMGVNNVGWVYIKYNCA